MKSKKKLIILSLFAYFCCVFSIIVSGGGIFFMTSGKDKKKDDDPSPSDTPSPSKQYTLRSANTNFDENGEGKVYYLDRHDVNCNKDGLNRFQLKNDYTDDTNHTMAYEFGCLTGLGITETTEKETTLDVDGDPPHTVYLDRHTVDCVNKPITQFKLGRNSDGDKIQYKYQCGNTTASSSCRDVTTGYDDQGAGNVIYLDKHAVKCNEGEYLSKFRLDVDDNDTLGKYRYEYKCCKP